MSTTAPRRQAPSIWFTCVLGALLCIPFGIKLMIAEPYPAVIMPSGSGSIDLSDDTYTFTHYRAYGIKASGEQEAIDLVGLIQPAHQQYLYSIFKNKLGLRSNPEKAIKLRGTDWTLASYTQPGATSEHQAEYRSELKSQLGNQYKGLLLQKVTVLGDIKTRNWIEENTDESTLIEL